MTAFTTQKVLFTSATASATLTFNNIPYSTPFEIFSDISLANIFYAVIVDKMNSNIYMIENCSDVTMYGMLF